MSYARKNLTDSDVYVWSDGVCYVCQDCDINGIVNYVVYYPREMLDHLLTHRENNYKVPEAAINRLKKELV